MNIALEQTEEYVNGQLKNKYGDAFIRGNNGTRFPAVQSTGASSSAKVLLLLSVVLVVRSTSVCEWKETFPWNFASRTPRSPLMKS